MSYSAKRAPKKLSTATNKQSSTQKGNKNNKGHNATQRTVGAPLICDHSSNLARRRILAQKSKNEEVKKFREMVREIYHQSDQLSNFSQTSALSIPPEVSSDRYLLGQYRLPKDHSYYSGSENYSRYSSEVEQSQEFDQEQLMKQIRDNIQNRYQTQREFDNPRKIIKQPQKAQTPDSSKNRTQNEGRGKLEDEVIIDGSQYLKEPIPYPADDNELEDEEEEEEKNNIHKQENQLDDFNENTNSQAKDNNEDQKDLDNEIEEEETVESDKEAETQEQNINENRALNDVQIEEESTNEDETQELHPDFNKELVQTLERAQNEVEAEIEFENKNLAEENEKNNDNLEEKNNKHQEYQEKAIISTRGIPEDELQEEEEEAGIEIEAEADVELEELEEEENKEDDILHSEDHKKEKSAQHLLNDIESPVQAKKVPHHSKQRAFRYHDPNSPTGQISEEEEDEYDAHQDSQRFDYKTNMLISGDDIQDPLPEDEEEDKNSEALSLQNKERQGPSTPNSKQNNFKLDFNYNDIDHYNPNLRPPVSPRSYKSPFSPQKKIGDQFRFTQLNPDDPKLKHSGEMLLEISIRPFLYNLSIKYGQPIKRLRDIPEYEFKDWTSMGFQWIWLYGVWKLGENCLNFDLTDPYLLKRYNEVLPGWTKEDVIGYPLSIVSYQINPELGDIDDLIWFRNKLKESHIKLMLDFVPNHTAIDAPEVTEHPEYYIHASQSDLKEGLDINRFIVDKGNIAYGAGKYMPPMQFTAQLNIFNEKAKEMQISNLISISNLCDGVRAHLAQYLLTEQFETFWKKELSDSGFHTPNTEFWKEAIDKVRSNNPNFVMMAESYGTENQMKLIECGFSYIYEKELIDHLVSNDVAGFRNLIFKNHFITDKMVHFIENHDEKRMVTRFNGNRKAAMTASAALLTLPGIRLINMHQWLGYQKQIDVNLRRTERESCDIEIVKFYNRLFVVLESNAVRYGSWKPLKVNDDDDKIIAWKWVYDDQHVLVTINFNNCWSQGKIICDDANTDSMTTYVREMLSETYYTRDPYEMRQEGLVLSMEPYQAQIFEY